MPVNPALRAVPGQELVVPGGPGRKTEPNAAADQAFAALLAMLVGAPAPVNLPVTPLPAGAEPAEGEQAVSPQPVSPQPVSPQPATPATAAQAAAAETTLLQAPRVAVGAPPARQPGKGPVLVPEGTWVIEPLPAQVPPVLEALAAEPDAPVPAPAQAEPVPELSPGPTLLAAPPVTPAPVEARARVPEEEEEQPAEALSELPTGLAEPRQVSFAPTADAKPAAAPPVRLPSPVDPDRLMAALARSLSSADDGSYSVTVRLHPEHLGEVKLSLQLQGREVQTMMEVGSAAARQALEGRSDQLRQSLDQAGLTLSGFQVSTGQQRRSPDDQSRYDWEEPARPRIVRPVTGTAPTAAPSLRSLTAGPGRRGGLDTLA